jgi:ABC-type uncharacterized transport system substrate-binding protein
MDFTPEDMKAVRSCLEGIDRNGRQPAVLRRNWIAARRIYRDRQRLADFTLRQKIASVFAVREFVDAGGLLSYGVNFPAAYRRAAEFVDNIAKGAKAADLPVEQPTRFELVVNLKTANALGLTIPITARARRRDDRITDCRCR